MPTVATRRQCWVSSRRYGELIAVRVEDLEEVPDLAVDGGAAPCKDNPTPERTVPRLCADSRRRQHWHSGESNTGQEGLGYPIAARGYWLRLAETAHRLGSLRSASPGPL